MAESQGDSTKRTSPTKPTISRHGACTGYDPNGVLQKMAPGHPTTSSGIIIPFYKAQLEKIANTRSMSTVEPGKAHDMSTTRFNTVPPHDTLPPSGAVRFN